MADSDDTNRTEFEGGLERYTNALLEAMRPFLEKAAHDRRDVISASIVADIVGVERPEVDRPEMTERDEYLADLLDGEIQIREALENVLDAPVYVRRFPYGDTRVTRVRHLRHSIETYFQDLYVLRERVTAYLNRIRKAHRSTRKVKEVAARVEELKRFLDSILDPVLETRGSHVHARRFSTPELDRLESLEFWANHEIMPEAQDILDRQYSDQRREWRDQIEKNNEATIKLVDAVFHQLHGVVFDEDGKVRLDADLR